MDCKANSDEEGKARAAYATLVKHLQGTQRYNATIVEDAEDATVVHFEADVRGFVMKASDVLHGIALSKEHLR